MRTNVHERRPGDDALRPSVLIAVSILLVNDHVLKIVEPSWITGKLSDATGLYAAPFMTAAIASLAAWAAGRPGPASHHVVALSALSVGAIFTAAKLVPEVAAAMGWMVGWIQALPAIVVSLLAGGEASIRQAPIVADATDLLTVPATGLAVLVGYARPCEAARTRRFTKGSKDNRMRAIDQRAEWPVWVVAAVRPRTYGAGQWSRRSNSVARSRPASWSLSTSRSSSSNPVAFASSRRSSGGLIHRAA